MCLKYSFAFKNAGNIQEPSIKAVGYSFDQWQVNEISDMQLFIRDGTINEKKKKNPRRDQSASDNQLWQICFIGNILRPHNSKVKQD